MASKAIGKVTVAAGGTAVRATSTQTDPTARVPAQSIMFQALPGNTGLVYIEQGGGANDRTNLTRTLAILSAPASATTGPFPSYTVSLPVTPAGFNLADYYLDVSVSGDGVLISVVQN